MLSRWSTTAGLAALLIHSSTLSAAVVRVPLDVPTIAEALTVAGEGGRILVAEGTHAGGFTITQSVTIEGGYPPNFNGPPDPFAHPSIIVGTASANAVNALLATGDLVSISGVICSSGVAGIDANLTDDAQLALGTVTCRNNNRGMRVDLHDTAAVFSNLVFLLDNMLEGSGAGLYAQVDGDAIVSLSAARIAGNSASAGGGGALVNLAGNAAVSFNAATFVGNGYLQAVGAAEPGTILYSVSGSAALFLNGSHVECNVGATRGDAAVGGTQTGDSLVQIVETRFREGEGGCGGEAIDARLAGTAALRLISNSFEDAANLLGPLVNIALDEQAVAFVLRNRFRRNTCATHLVTSEQLGASFASFDGNVLRRNTTPDEALALSISSNAAGALLRVINNQVSRNVATLGSGGGRFSVDGPNIAQVGHNTFYENISASGVAGIHLVASSISPAEASNNVAIGNLAGGTPADLLVEGFLARQRGNFLTGQGDPGFRNPRQGDFRLVRGSILIDTGHPQAFKVDHDFQEDDRPAGKGYDVGSDEFTGWRRDPPVRRSQPVRASLGARP